MYVSYIGTSKNSLTLTSCKFVSFINEQICQSLWSIHSNLLHNIICTLATLVFKNIKKKRGRGWVQLHAKNTQFPLETHNLLFDNVMLKSIIFLRGYKNNHNSDIYIRLSNMTGVSLEAVTVFPSGAPGFTLGCSYF